MLLALAGGCFTTELPGKPPSSSLSFGFFFFLAARHVGSAFPDQELNWYPLHWKAKS